MDPSSSTSHHSGSSRLPTTSTPYLHKARWKSPLHPRHCCIRHPCSSFHCLPCWADWGIGQTVFPPKLHSLLPFHVFMLNPGWGLLVPSFGHIHHFRSSRVCSAHSGLHNWSKWRKEQHLFIRFDIGFTSQDRQSLTSSSAFVFGQGEDLILSARISWLFDLFQCHPPNGRRNRETKNGGCFRRRFKSFHPSVF